MICRCRFHQPGNFLQSESHLLAHLVLISCEITNPAEETISENSKWSRIRSGRKHRRVLALSRSKNAPNVLIDEIPIIDDFPAGEIDTICRIIWVEKRHLRLTTRCIAMRGVQRKRYTCRCSGVFRRKMWTVPTIHVCVRCPANSTA